MKLNKNVVLVMALVGVLADLGVGAGELKLAFGDKYKPFEKLLESIDETDKEKDDEVKKYVYEAFHDALTNINFENTEEENDVEEKVNE